MKKIVTLALSLSVIGASLYASGFEKRYEMMNSRINSKMEKFQGNVAALEFLSKKLVCVKAAKSEDELKSCKKKFHPKELKKIVN